MLALLNPTSLVETSGYAAIFLLSVAQSCCVPTSSELTMGFAGVLAAEGKLSLPGAIAARDSEDAGDRHVEGLARLDPDVEITSGLPNEIIRLDRTESKAPVADEIPPVEIETFPGLEPLRPGFDGADAETSAQPIESVPLLSSALVFSTQLILKARHPRPLRFRRFVSSKHDRDPGHRPDPL